MNTVPDSLKKPEPSTLASSMSMGFKRENNSSFAPSSKTQHRSPEKNWLHAVSGQPSINTVITWHRRGETETQGYTDRTKNSSAFSSWSIC
ncbi:hypothetical protein I79_012124 [Cricetulus griseus]|uniref:Uncharacterized protein n=1 Tax=Cricetulus griseus TaxID=10029 RepID=G3HMZ4_CRIGR|nr:hypothetical protein I79_012124 [Cricetulus griseus]